mmetsp:Transcript_19134/g.32028  ORF Transcript_19134/g.32028 Transcript_19134/m.32028 type:complete len:181 (-) Transcript_19134:42-584(-)
MPLAQPMARGPLLEMAETPVSPSAKPKACSKRDIGCMQTDRQQSQLAGEYMVPWRWTSGKGAATAVAELSNALRQNGAREVRTSAVGVEGVIRVTARFSSGAFGLVTDDEEFILSPATSTVAFRAASSQGLFDSSADATQRNRQRLVRIRFNLERRFGWKCACPPDTDPLTAVKCSVLCS